MDLEEPKDSEIKDIRNYLEFKIGSDLADKMFSYESSRVFETFEKIENLIKQKIDIPNIWECILRWIYIRVFDSARQAL